MVFQKGHKKIGGRKRGKANEITPQARALLKAFVDGEITALPSITPELTAKERIDALKGLLPYVYPKKQEIDVRTEINAILSNLDNLTEEQLTRLKEIIIETQNG